VLMVRAEVPKKRKAPVKKTTTPTTSEKEKGSGRGKRKEKLKAPVQSGSEDVPQAIVQID